ncbi:MAG: long-chain-fatty-acid--CoA ligase, partial [Candidatus Methylomirabilales bacterium]
AEKYPKKAALIFYDRLISYRELDELTNRFAHALLQLGVKKGERVALMLPNIPQAVIGYYGVLKAGGVVVQVNPLLAERELTQQLQDAEAETILLLDRFFQKVQHAKEKAALRRIIVTGAQDFLPLPLRLLYPFKAGRERFRVEKRPPVYDMRALLKAGRDDPPAVPIRPDDIALLQYTGGTTGTPKGVILTHRNLVVNALQCRAWFPELREGEEVLLGVLPFFHVYGLSICLNLGIMLASTIVLLPRFQAQEVLKAIKKYRVTLFPGVPAMYAAINHHPGVKGDDLRSVKLCVSGAGPLHPRIQERFEALTGGRLVEGYGLSEASPVTHCNPVSGKRKVGSIGVPLPDTDARIVDLETGEQEVPIGEVGELIVKGPQVMGGYWKNPEEEARTLRDGWLYTGDIGRMDEEGYFYIIDRKKDMILASGYNVYPRDVEEVLYQHPAVQETVVVGVPDSYRGENVKAYIVVKQGAALSEEEIISFCREKLAAYKVPRLIEFRSELPKTAVGKILRRTLRDEARKEAVN